MALRAHGYESAVALEGGWRAWREAWLPVEPRRARVERRSSCP